MKETHIIANVNDLNQEVVKTHYSLIEYYAKDYQIYLDTDILLNSALPCLLMHLLPVLVRYQKKAYVTETTIRELERQALENQGDWNDFCRIVDVMNLIMNYDMFAVVCDEDMAQGGAEGTLGVVLAAAETSHVLTLTENLELVYKIQDVRRTRSRKAKVLETMRINGEGFLELHEEHFPDDKVPTEMLLLDIRKFSAVRNLVRKNGYEDIGKYVRMFWHISQRLANTILSICGERVHLTDIVLVALPDEEDVRGTGIVFTEKSIYHWMDGGRSVVEIAYDRIQRVGYDDENVMVTTTDGQEYALFCGEDAKKKYSMHMCRCIEDVKNVYQGGM